MKTKNAKTATTPTSKIHLAVCLCIVDDLPHEEVWKHWIESSKENASLYIHAKHPEKVTSQYGKSKLLSISHKPNWNDVRVVKAMLSLAQEAFKDERVTHVYFGTESCIPIVTLPQALASLESGKSYLQYYEKSQATRFEERECWSPVEQHVPSDAIYKALPGWCVLSRPHVQAILDIPCDLPQAFEKCWAPEEVYFATALSLLGLLNDEEVENKSLVHAEWNERAKNHQDRAHPREYSTEQFDEGLVEHVKRKGCIVMRKVKRRMPLSLWKRVVLGEYTAGDKRRREDDERRYRSDDYNYEDRSRHSRRRRDDGHRHHHHRHREDSYYDDRSRHHDNRRRYR
jgi:hypothetical protein